MTEVDWEPGPEVTGSAALTSYRPEMRPPPPGVRIGDRVRCTTGDAFLAAGNEGLVVNTVPARAGRPAQVRVLWDDETITITPLADVQVLPRGVA